MPQNYLDVLDTGSLGIFETAVKKMNDGFRFLGQAGEAGYDPERLKEVLQEVSERMLDNFPYFHPLYAGQMLKPPHPVARLAYMLAMFINPNNHALDGGRASSQMEKEAVSEIAKMFGWDRFLGHLCGGGTMANLEALWIAGQLNPSKIIVASEQAHYTHSRISNVLNLEFTSVETDRLGRIDVDALIRILERGNVGTVVATMGTTATGSIDPLPQILELREKYGFRIHADAAYGGYYTLARSLGPDARHAFDLLNEADSIVVDPHKHGLQPYGCGCVLFRDPSVGHFYKHDSPYTYFSSKDLHLGEISLECSRPGASAVALWATQQMFPLVRDGEMAAMLEKCRNAALKFHEMLQSDKRFITAFVPELDIVIWAPRAASVSEASRLSRELFNQTGNNNLHLAVAGLPVKFFNLEQYGMKKDDEKIVCLRSVLMKPEHEEWIGRIWDILDRSAGELGIGLRPEGRS